ncbi:MAG: hypothetical protein K8J31_20990, partial [Anaerolineae bacterium]|nr:hypothetical protein [Anaerolineae bacterium]
MRLLINVDTFTAEPLFETDLVLWDKDHTGLTSTDVNNPVISYKFSEDDTLVRYVMNESATATFSLIEHDLSSGSTKDVASTPDLDFVVHVDGYGEKWLFSRPDWSEGLLVYVDGTNRWVDLPGAKALELCELERTGYRWFEAIERNCTEFAEYWQVTDRTVYVYDRFCKEDCIIIVYPDSNPVDALLN